MARRMLIAGNWKLHMTLAEALRLGHGLRQSLAEARDCDLVVAPPYTALASLAQTLAGSNIAVGAQDLFWESEGAYTGAISAPLLRDAGCTYALVGHSERRKLFGETLETSGKRVAAALRAGLVPILCVGESLQERQSERTWSVLEGQLTAALGDLGASDLAPLVVAYEPLWAIGTGQVASPAQAQAAHAFLRDRLSRRAQALGDGTRLLYGGSVKADNAAYLLAQPDIDGALVGGASLEAQSFADIVRARPAVGAR